MIVIVAGGAHRLQQMYIDRAGMNPQRAFWHDLDRAVDNDGHDRSASGNRQDEWAFLERTKRIGVTAGSFGEDNHRRPAADPFSRYVVCSKRCLSVFPLDL